MLARPCLAARTGSWKHLYNHKKVRPLPLSARKSDSGLVSKLKERREAIERAEAERARIKQEAALRTKSRLEQETRRLSLEEEDAFNELSLVWEDAVERARNTTTDGVGEKIGNQPTPGVQTGYMYELDYKQLLSERQTEISGKVRKSYLISECLEKLRTKLLSLGTGRKTGQASTNCTAIHKIDYLSAILKAFGLFDFCDTFKKDVAPTWEGDNGLYLDIKEGMPAEDLHEVMKDATEKHKSQLALLFLNYEEINNVIIEVKTSIAQKVEEDAEFDDPDVLDVGAFNLEKIDVPDEF